MKKLYILLFGLLVPSFVFSQYNLLTEKQPQVQFTKDEDFFILDSILARNIPPYDSVVKRQTLYTYYDDGNVKQIIINGVYYNDTNFINYSNVKYEYDQDGRVNKYTSEGFIPPYMPSIQILTTWYDDDYYTERIINDLGETGWTPSKRIFSPNLGQSDSIITYFFNWNIQNSNWDTTEYNISYLNENNLVYLIKRYKSPPNWQYVNSSLIDYTSSGDTLQITHSGGYLITFEYNNQGLLTKKRYLLDWDMWYEYMWNYNSANLIWKYYYFSKSPIYPDVYGGLKYEYIYKDYNVIDYRTEYDLDNGSPYRNEFYYYSNFYVNINENPYLETKIFPNPSSGRFTIQFSLENEEQVKLLVLNSLGQVVAILTNEKLSNGGHELNWNAEGMPAGVYFYNIQIGNQAGTGKMVLMK